MDVGTIERMLSLEADIIHLGKGASVLAQLLWNSIPVKMNTDTGS
jgi:hypothetical protein